jgi:two-component system nitrogen regulation response regulator GlnG
LLVRKPVEVGRLDTQFAPPDAKSDAGRPLEDRYVSRTPLRIKGDPRTALMLEYERDDVLVDGAPLAGSRELDRAALERGIVIELAERIVLLLHLCEGAPVTEWPGLLGASDGIDQVRREVERVAPLDTPVLLRGESGTGKEQVAQAIHERSRRKARTMLAVNMAAIPTTTAASALFGHARGAFTGATDRQSGLFERAHESSLLLDEIGETPGDVQPMLLRVLETQRFAPLGDPKERSVDVRVLAATDADLERDVESGHFRRALLHRLQAYEIRVPPLRERREDIPRLFLSFLRAEAKASGDGAWLATSASDEVPRVPASLIARLLSHPLDGNVRQLRNLAQRIWVASRGKPQLVIEPAVERVLGQPVEATTTVASSRDPAEIGDEELVAQLEKNRWRPGKTAAALGIPTSTLHDLMRRCAGIRKAKDLDDRELREAAEACNSDTERMAETLRVSERALRITLRERGLLPQS